MAKNNNIWIFAIIGIFIVLLIFNSNSNQPKQTSITATYYDANGNKINFQPYDFDEATKLNKNTFSIFGLFGVVNPDSCTNCINESNIPTPLLPSSNVNGGTS